MFAFKASITLIEASRERHKVAAELQLIKLHSFLLHADKAFFSET